SENPPRLDNTNQEALRLYNQVILQDLYDLDVNFAPDALIPTPTLRYNFLQHVIHPGCSIIELGTGASAIIALLAAKKFNATVYATEMDLEYIDIANSNIQHNNLSDQIQIFNSHGKYLKGVIPTDVKVDYILSNPPYYEKILSPKVIWGGKQHELVSTGVDGTTFIMAMIREGWDYLKTPGTIAFLIPKTRQDMLIAIEEYIEHLKLPFDILALLAGNRTRFLFRIFKQPLSDSHRLSDMEL
ncbi:MAG: RlmF-related methyltransferase, partial [Candidatus Heimdallarchaeota archaeon]|nr:RlmF-related methyltransferase [Candidatus Heimdallarchaeota archaeon]